MRTERQEHLAGEEEAAPLPTGTVTFLFTDIEGSTRLVQDLGTRYPAVLAEHRRLIDSAIAEHGGRVFGTEGDAVFAAFDDAPSAIEAAAGAQRALQGHAWPDAAPLRVRMGVHTGEAVLSGGDYVGLALHQVARIAAAAHGGQVIVSAASRALAAQARLPGVELRDLGEHRLKDLAHAERLFQLDVDGLPVTFPAPRTLSARPNNLPVQLTSFVGRDEIDEARRLLGKTRLLTLTGPGGTGKTRLALQLAAELMDDFPDGVYFAALDAVDDADLVPSAIADALGIEPGAEPPLERVIGRLRERRALLVLDNFEQVLGAGPGVGRLLREAPNVKVVVTSRIVLRTSGEQEFAVPPLALPPIGAEASVDEVGRSEAVRLFVERALAAQPAFRLEPSNAPAVAEIVSRLDGLPLAIELAAARIRLLPVETLRARLDQRLATLTGGARDLPARQQTLRGAIDWSYDLLDEPDRRLFARFAVFAGGACLNEVERVAGPASELGREVLDGLGSLAEKSLLRAVPGAGDEARFAMLATIRDYALERLVDGGEADDLRRRHAAAYLELAEGLAGQLMGRHGRRSLDRLALDHDNLRAAIDGAIDRGEAETAFRLGTALWRFWQARGHLDEGRERFGRILATPGADALPPAVRSRALGAAGGIEYWRGDIAATHARYAPALEEARRSGDRPIVAEALYNLGFAAASEFASEDDRYVAGRALWEQSLAAFRELGDDRGVAGATWALAISELSRRDFTAARRLFEESRGLYRSIDDPFGEGWANHMLGMVSLVEHDPDGAEEDFRDALTSFDRTSDQAGILLLLIDFAIAARERGDLPRHWRLAGAADVVRSTTGVGLADQTPIEYVDWTLPEAPFGDPEAERWWAEGRAMSVDEAVAYALTGEVAARS
ncbi:MAG TPA: adenylate/guanylate cyclase domain-containing protein [Candidatus Limnocylindrales bacterium]|nr:adenylate/guanylate cyclase domain-containing protein [Candidatus Limnocylindrales bacterium]